MLRTYFTIAYRNFFRNKIFSLINVLGLSIGISASLVIFLIVRYEFNFDQFETDQKQVYRVVTDMNFFGSEIHNSGVPSPLPEAIRREVTGVKEVIGFHKYNGDPNVSITRKPNEKPLVFKNQPAIILADSGYFKLVHYKWLAGYKQSALDAPLKVVLTADRARLYFPTGSFDAMIGRQIVYDDTITTTVSGIVKELPESSDFIFKEFISQSTIPGRNLKGNYAWENWGSVNGGSQLLIRLDPAASPKNVEAQIQLLEVKYDKNNTNPNSKRYFRLQPFADMHFNPLYANFGDHTASKPALYGLLTVAAFLLALACINFINLTTAQSAQRAKEIGVRKTMGSSRKQLVFQFLSETFFVTLISLILSIFFVPILLKIFADFIPAGLKFDLFHQPFLILFALGLTVVVAFLSGFYPAMVLSRLKAILVLKNQAYHNIGSNRKALLRKTLTVAQFLIAQVFIMATLIAVKQINFALNKDMGFKKEAIIVVPTPFPKLRNVNLHSAQFVFLDKIKRLPGVQLVSLGGDEPASEGWSSNSLKYKDGKKEIETDVRLKFGDTNYLKVYQIKLLAGRNVHASDTAGELVINETYLHMLGFQNPKDILNKQIDNLPVVGVMADFNQESLHSSIKPLAFSTDLGNSWNLHIALRTENAGANAWLATIRSIEKDFKEIYPEEDFSYAFMDENIAKFYKTEQDMSRLLKWATGLAVFISCIGLLGLVIYTTNQRTKEIGIRKVLGASISQIVTILSSDFVRLVLLASVIAIPVAWWAMHKWLNNFAYKTTVNWWIFVLSALLMLFMALITLSIQTIRAASANPVDSLRNE
jgi:putative ABC transport system permease protein